MKKLVSLCLAIFMIFAILPVSAFADGDSFESYDYQVALAKQIFPEYRDKLEGKGVATYASQPGTKPSIAVRETRPVDDNTDMTYTEYNNGLVTLSMARFQKSTSNITTGVDKHDTYTEYTAKIVGSVIEGPTFTATDVKYRIYPSDYDRVLSSGSYSIPGYSSSKFTVSIRGTETSSLPAYVSYDFPCPVGVSYYSGRVGMIVQNNKSSVYFDIW
ncbi:MAG TPA: hypothetical protein DCO69_03410 [Clostridiales bacterium]|nr:hypothetical protein [Clostridiales bacterium]